MFYLRYGSTRFLRNGCHPNDDVVSETRKARWGSCLYLTLQLYYAWLCVRTPVGGESFLPHPDWPRDPISFLYNGYRVCFFGVNRLKRGVDHTPSSSAESVNECAICLHSSYGTGWLLPPPYSWLPQFQVCLFYFFVCHFPFFIHLQKPTDTLRRCCVVSLVYTTYRVLLLVHCLINGVLVVLWLSSTPWSTLKSLGARAHSFCISTVDGVVACGTSGPTQFLARILGARSPMSLDTTCLNNVQRREEVCHFVALSTRVSC
jgi:hypothetical protein